MKKVKKTNRLNAESYLTLSKKPKKKRHLSLLCFLFSIVLSIHVIDNLPSKVSKLFILRTVNCFFVLKKKENKENTHRTCLVPNFFV